MSLFFARKHITTEGKTTKGRPFFSSAAACFCFRPFVLFIYFYFAYEDVFFFSRTSSFLLFLLPLFRHFVHCLVFVVSCLAHGWFVRARLVPLFSFAVEAFRYRNGNHSERKYKERLEFNIETKRSLYFTYTQSGHSGFDRVAAPHRSYCFCSRRVVGPIGPHVARLPYVARLQA